METLFRILGYLALPVTIWTLAKTVKRWRRQSRLTPLRLALPVVVAGGLLIVYVTMLGVAVPATRSWLPMILGVAGGVAAGRRAHVAIDRGTMVGTRSLWTLAIWIGAYTLTQILALSGAGATTAVLAVVFLSTGATVGESGWLLIRRAQMLPHHGGPAPAAAGGAAATLLLVLLVLPGSIAGAEDAHEIGDVMGGRVDRLSASVRGTGTFYGTSLLLVVQNDTETDQRILVPVGTRFEPDDAGVQTMLSSGGEQLVAPPGESQHGVKALCGEYHDEIPDSGDVFGYGGRVGGALLGTLENIHAADQHGRAGQHAVWHLTDGRDLTGDPWAQDLVASGGPDPGDAGQAGLMVVALALGLQLIDERSAEKETLLLSGREARDWLTGTGADWPGKDDVVETREGRFLKPPARTPDEALGISYDTEDVNVGGEEMELIREDDFTIVRERHRPDAPAIWDEWQPEGSESPEAEVASLLARYDLDVVLERIDGEWRVIAPQNLSDRADATVFETKVVTDSTGRSFEVIDTDEPVIVIGVPRPEPPPPTSSTPAGPTPGADRADTSGGGDGGGGTDAGATSERGPGGETRPPGDRRPPPTGTGDVVPDARVGGSPETSSAGPTPSTTGPEGAGPATDRPASSGTVPPPVRPSPGGTIPTGGPGEPPPAVSAASTPATTAPGEAEPAPTTPGGFDRKRFATAAAIGITQLTDDGRRAALAVLDQILPEGTDLPDLSDPTATRRFLAERLARATPETLVTIQEKLALAESKLWATGLLPKGLLESAELLAGLDDRGRVVFEAVMDLDENDQALVERTIRALVRAAGKPPPKPPTPGEEGEPG